MAEGFGEYLRRELRARKWTIRYCSVRSGVAHSTISRLVRGQQMPTLMTAWRLTEALEGAADLPDAAAPTHTPKTDPRQRVADALRRDRVLDRRSIDLVLDYYDDVRSRGGPPARR